MRIFSALRLRAGGERVELCVERARASQPRIAAIWRWPLGVEVLAGVRDLLGGVEHGAVVDPDRVGVLVLDDGAVHERAEVLERLVVQVAAGDPLRDGLGELRGDLVHVGEAVGHRDRDLLAGRALGDAGADLRRGASSWRRRLCARLGEIPRSAQTAAIRSCSRSPARASQQSRSCSCWSTSD